MVRETPKAIAAVQDERIVQMIDEYQFINAMIYWDKELTRLAYDLAGGYLSTAESKVAPLLVSGRWAGFDRNPPLSIPPRCFRRRYLEN